MTWLWVKKRQAGMVILYLTLLLSPSIYPTMAEGEAATTTPTNTTTGEGGGEGGGVYIQNSSAYKPFVDLTNFLGGVNNWDFMGAWAKYDLSKVDEKDRPVPLVPDAQDQGVFICQVSQAINTLEKKFPTLHNATLYLNYYAKAAAGDLSMTGEVVGDAKVSETFFNYSGKTGHADGTWATENFALPSLAAEGDFKIRFSVHHSAGSWAAAEIKVEGKTGPPITTTTSPPTTAPPPPPTTPLSNLTQANTTTETNLNQTETTTTITQVNGTTVVPVNVTTIPTTTTTEEDKGLSKLESVAQAVWDAFYVFLALFCACLVALVALIVHGRCKDDEPPPAVATYNPRTASYRMDKVYDNPSYDNNSV